MWCLHDEVLPNSKERENYQIGCCVDGAGENNAECSPKEMGRHRMNDLS